ncbi:MAG: 50S ribosomal protein L6 [Candidatus Pacearchaeota archaeon]|nr:50S ribosomal protein L6 [Candidatus Pacearchaeota archaeon]
MKKKIRKTIRIPEKVDVKIELPKITVSGPQGTLEREFKLRKVKVKKENDEIILEHEKATKNDKKLLNSIAAHISNMIKGVEEKYEYKLQICSVHFPITINIDKEKNSLVIKNFLGENKDREVRIRKDVDVKINGEFIVITSANKEEAGQQAADIENITKIKAKDRRVFQDGIWIVKKEKGRHKRE